LHEKGGAVFEGSVKNESGENVRLWVIKQTEVVDVEVP
jgi:hypothetical protein